MIKKSVFEDELIRGMHCELVKQAHNVEVQDLSSAVDYLNSAAQILEEIGMIEASDKVLNVLLKIAVPSPSSSKVVHKGLPAMKIFLDAGLTANDLANVSNNIVIGARVVEILEKLGYTPHNIISLLGERVIRGAEQVKKMKSGDLVATAKVNAQLRDLGKNDPEIIAAIGFKHFMPEKEVKNVLTTSALDIIPKSTRDVEVIETLYPDELESKANKKPKDPTKISDRHTKGLTSEKMVNNLKNHGTVFNMADDGSYDILNADIDDDLIVSEDDSAPFGDFEDEID